MGTTIKISLFRKIAWYNSENKNLVYKLFFKKILVLHRKVLSEDKFSLIVGSNSIHFSLFSAKIRKVKPGLGKLSQD